MKERHNPNPTFGVVDQRTLGSYNRALHRLRDKHSVEFKKLLREERNRDIPSVKPTPIKIKDKSR